MSDITTLAVQKATKPKIEDVIPCYVGVEALKTALDFIAYLRENKIKPVWTLHNAWKGTYKGKVIYYIRLPLYRGHFRSPKRSSDADWMRSWVFTPYLHNINRYEDQIMEEGLQDLVWDNLHYCKPCAHRKCLPECDKVILGKELKNLCRGDLYGGCAVWFVSPDETTINGIKRLLELEKKARDENVVK